MKRSFYAIHWLCKLSALLVLFIIAPSVQAASCYTKGVAFDGKQIILSFSASHPVVFLVHNISNIDLWLTHPSSGKGVEAGWTSLIKSQRWSVIALNRSPFVLDCQHSLTGKMLDCHQIIASCRLGSHKIKAGGYWLAENIDFSQLKSKLQLL